MAAMDRVESGQSQRPGMPSPSPMEVAGAHAFEPSSGFPSTLAEGWIGSEAAGTGTGLHMGCHNCRQQLNALHHNTGPK